jgi:hypothetical protein
MPRRSFVILALAAALAACSGASSEPSAALLPTAAPATSLAQGAAIRLGTPNPSPDCPDHTPWFFNNPGRECATLPVNSWAVMQRFERGLMIWFQSSGETDILLDDRSPLKPYHGAVDTAGVAEPPGPDPALSPPAGLSQPVRGFAKFWRGLVPGYDWVRPALGWAIGDESGYSALYQCNTASDPAAARCYFNGPFDEIIALSHGPDGQWAYAKPPR